MYTLTLTLS